MSRELAGLLGANVLVLAVGVGAISLLGAARSPRDLLTRLGLAYLAGLAVVGIAAATLALVRVPAGWLTLGALAAAALALGLPRLSRDRAREAAPRTLLGWSAAVSLAGSVALAAILVQAWPVFASTAIETWDAWAIWSMKARALYEFGWADPVVFANPAHPHTAYPLLLPALEALQFRAMGGFDAQMIHVQFLLIGIGLVAGIGGILHDRTPPWLLWPTLVAIATAPAMLGQLLTAYADIPLAAFFAAGTAAAGRWLVYGERWCLAVASLFYAAALLTKYEAMVFVAVAFLALAASQAVRGRLRESSRPLLLAAAAASVPLALWRIYVAAHDLGTGHARPDPLMFEPAVVPIALRRLLSEMLDVTSWGYLLPLTLAALAVAAFFPPSRALAVFGLIVVALPVAALTAFYAASPLPHDWYLRTTAHRIVASLVLAGASLTPLVAAVVARSWAERPSARRRR